MELRHECGELWFEHGLPESWVLCPLAVILGNHPWARLCSGKGCPTSSSGRVTQEGLPVPQQAWG